MTNFTSMLVLCGLWSGPAVAQTPQQDFMAGFGSAKVEFLPSQGVRAHRPASGFMDRVFDVLSQKPNFSPRSYSAACRSQVFEKDLLTHKSAVDQANILQSYLHRCRDEVETKVDSRNKNIFQILRLRFDDLSHPFMRRVNLHLPGGAKLHAILALKGDLQRRPFVILRLGIFGNVEEYFVESFVFRQLFEQGPFNVLVVENSTSKMYLEQNPGFALGGAVEGPQNLQLARILRDPAEPLSKLVESVHLVGLSLGGHGVLHAAALDAHQDSPLPLFSSHLALCPVVRLKETLYDAIRPGLEGTFFDAWVSVRTPALRRRAPQLENAGWGTWWRLRPFYLQSAVEYAESIFPVTPKLTEGLKMPPHGTTFWEASEPWPWFRDLKAPVLLLATTHDEVVPPELNSQALIKELFRKKTRDDVSVVMLDKGYHCTLPVAYHWDFVSSFLNSSLLAHTSRSFKEVHQDLDVTELVRSADPAGVETGHSVAWAEDRPHPTLKVWLRVPGGVETVIPLEVSPKDLDFKFLNAETSEAERQMVEAWLSRNVFLRLMKDGERWNLRVGWKLWSAGVSSGGQGVALRSQRFQAEPVRLKHSGGSGSPFGEVR